MLYIHNIYQLIIIIHKYVYMLSILTTRLSFIVYNKTIHIYVQNAIYLPKVLIKILFI